jgi:hypothetical protein
VLAGCLTVAGGCGGGAAGKSGSTAPVATVTRLVQRDRVLVLEAWGTLAQDTSLMVPVNQRRVVILRHGAPDNTVFAEISFPPGTFDAPDVDSVRVTLIPLPGIYGLNIIADAPIGPGAELVFKYPLHFASPAGALERYGTDAAFEEALFIGRLLDDGRVAVLPPTRPASDNLRGVLPTGGAYVVAGPR